MATQSELAQIQHILGKRRNLDQNPLDLSARKKSREYLDSHKDVEKRRRDRINTCLDTIRTLVPLCHQLPRHRRVDKADLLDLAIIYLRMVNQFLEKLGINDIFSAAHQQVSLFTSLEKWVREQGEKSQDIPSFTKEILAFLEGEIETASHVIASQQTAGNATPASENGFQQNSEWMKHEQAGLDDEMSGPRSCLTSSGSDEERSQGSYRDRENRSSGSEDSVGIGSPSSCVSGRDIQRTCFQSSSIEGTDGPILSSGNDGVRFERSSSASRYDSFVSQNVTKVHCVDKAVNTDASSTNCTWPPDSTFTLPIISGKIVLHTPSGVNGTNNLNAPVTLHAEIHSSPFQNQPPAALQENESHPQQSTDGKSCSVRSSGANALPREPICLSPRSSGSKISDNTPFNHKACFNNNLPTHPLSSKKTSHDIAVPVPRIHPDRFCLPPERQSAPMTLDEAYIYDEAEMKSYTSLVPLRRSIEESGSPYPTLPSHRSPTTHTDPGDCDSNYRDDRNGPYFKRYVDALGQPPQDRSSNSNNGKNKSCTCCTNTSSSLKLKSLMVHRHQTQHIMSR